MSVRFFLTFCIERCFYESEGEGRKGVEKVMGRLRSEFRKCAFHLRKGRIYEGREKKQKYDLAKFVSV